MTARALKRPQPAAAVATAPGVLAPAQRQAAHAFAETLIACMTRGDDVRGVLLAEVAAYLAVRGQFFTSRLLQRAADQYEGKA